MPTVEVILDSEDTDDPLFVAEFAFLPRVGEHIARDTQGYFDYYDVVKVWHRQVGADGTMTACVAVKIND